jgi:hypothetical protein
MRRAWPPNNWGCRPNKVAVRPYKLLVYEKGGFFLPHRDSEKQDGMVASLIVVLANPFEGGALVVRHGAGKQDLRFEQVAQGKAPCYAAFYADCEHEVQRVTHGVRLCLAYNLVLRPKRATRAEAGEPPAPANVSGDKRRHLAPDVFVVKGVAKHRRDHYLIWQEGRGPNVVFEYTSKTTRDEDIEDKFRLYRDVLQVPEYFLFDPLGDYLTPNLQCYRLVQGEYVRIRAPRAAGTARETPCPFPFRNSFSGRNVRGESSGGVVG